MGLLFSALICGAGVAQIPEFESRQPGPVIVAVVNSEPIYLAEVHRYLRKLPTTTDGNLAAGETNALAALVQRQIVLEHLIRKNFVSTDAVDAQVESRRRELARRNELLDAICEEQGISVPALRRAIAWNIAWPKYLNKYLTHERLQRYFEEHSAHFDGGNRDVAHILWKLSEPTTKEEKEDVVQTAIEVRQRVASGEITFADAAREYSAGPSAKAGGELGSIDRDGPMTERFSAAAFDLQPNAISEPIVDAFGVHLIQCLQAEPGRRKFKEMRSKVEQAARAELFATVARRSGKNAKIEYTGRIPVTRP